MDWDWLVIAVAVGIIVFGAITLGWLGWLEWRDRRAGRRRGGEIEVPWGKHRL